MKIHFQYSPLYLLFCLAFALLVALVLYLKSRPGIDERPINPIAYGLFGLRLIAIFIISVLLLNPFLKLLKYFVEKPVIAFYVDNSESIRLSDTTLPQLVVAEMNKQLGDKFNIEMYSFGEHVGKSDINFHEKQTDISQPLEFTFDRYRNKNLAAVVLMSDGIFNLGNNPLYRHDNVGASLYTVALGDTTPKIDAVIKEVIANEIVYFENIFPVKVQVAARRLKGQELQLRLLEDGKPIDEKKLEANSDNFNEDVFFYVEAKTKGTHQYRAVIDTKENEINIENNTLTTVVEVMDAARKVLLLAAAPHPDVAAIRKSLERNKNYSVKTLWIGSDAFVNEMADFKQGSFDLAILHNLPSIQSNKDLFAKLESANLPMMLFCGTEMNFNALSALSLGVQIIPKSTSFNQIQGLVNPGFTLFVLDNQSIKTVEQFPPLFGPFADIKLPAAQNLLYQKIGAVKTSIPLLSFIENGNRKVAVFAAEGIWRWFVYDYAKNKNNLASDELFNKTIQYLAIKQDRRQFKILSKKRMFDENENVVFTAELLNKSFENVRDGKITMTIVSESDKEYVINFSQTNGSYVLNAGNLAAGTYTFTAVAINGSEKFETSGSFIVKEIKTEKLNTMANHKLLYQLANANGGAMYLPRQIDKLTNEILNNDEYKAISHQKAEIAELIHEKWLFFLVLALLTIEWAVRKFNGVY